MRHNGGTGMHGQSVRRNVDPSTRSEPESVRHHNAIKYQNKIGSVKDRMKIRETAGTLVVQVRLSEPKYSLYS